MPGRCREEADIPERSGPGLEAAATLKINVDKLWASEVLWRIDSGAFTAQGASAGPSGFVGHLPDCMLSRPQPLLSKRRSSRLSAHSQHRPNDDHGKQERSHHAPGDEGPIHNCTVSDARHTAVSDIPAGSSAALLVRILLTVVELVNVGQYWWTFDGPATARTVQKRSLFLSTVG